MRVAIPIMYPASSLKIISENPRCIGKFRAMQIGVDNAVLIVPEGRLVRSRGSAGNVLLFLLFGALCAYRCSKIILGSYKL